MELKVCKLTWWDRVTGDVCGGGGGGKRRAAREGAGAWRELEALLNVWKAGFEGQIYKSGPQSYKMRRKSLLQVESTFLSLYLRTAPQ